MMRYVIAVFSIVIMVAAAIYMRHLGAAEKKSQQENIYTFIKKECGFAIPWQSTVTCGELRTPKNSGGFSLAFAILHDDSPQHQSDPVVYLQGGPGSGGRIHKDGIEQWLVWKNYANLARDIILIDPRGTGRSRPAIKCDEYSHFNRSLMRKNLSLSDELAQGYEVVTRCFSALENSQPPVAHQLISTQKNAEDVRALMLLLKYSEWNILGVSYGTRLALEIARQEQMSPQAVRLKSMVLDSVYPAGYGGVQTWPQVLDEAMQTFFVGCEKETACGAKHQLSTPLLDRFNRALKQLQQHPMELTVPRWDGEAPITFLVNDHRFLSASFAAIYDPHDWPNIVTAIAAVEQGKTEGLKPIIEPYINNSFNADFNSLTFMAVDCADNPIKAQQDYDNQVQKFPLWAEYTRDQWRYQSCHALQRAESESALTLAASAVPSLLIAGRLDPITPVQWAEELHGLLPQSQLVVRNKLAHSVLSSDTCLLENLRYYFDSPTHEFSVCIEPKSD